MRASSALRSRIRLCRSDVVVVTAFCAASTELAIDVLTSSASLL